ncbi:probable carboxylesterase 17 [Ziziphus jujuba]|uniref:Probable carboxylesterase 17 n=1 Tax=Ziziphus jujuba TaxID=326968 RepID=A0A6P4ACH5_ZIZJJ|nr:probable carboxylesterase 17 [Ziziphus jujuba]
MSIVAEAPGFLQVFSDGSVKRFAPQVVDASEESSKGYRFKDVVIDPSKPITGRIFLPDTPRSTTQLLPLVVYFHGGGFCFGSTTWAGYHYFLGDFSVASQSIVVSVDYRLAPENRLPVAYEDCYSSLEWLSHQVSTEPWLSGADLSRVFLSGDSAGGNIAHNVAVKYICEQINNVKIRGLVLIHPYFGSEKRTEEELDEGAAGHVASNDMFWGLSIPEGSNRDYFGCNVEKAELSESQWSQFPAVMVHVAGLDFLKQRGVMYVEFLQKKQVKEVKLVEAEAENHVFHVFFPESDATRLLQQETTEFIKSY